MANKVIAGDYVNCSVMPAIFGAPYIGNFPEKIALNKNTVDSYEVVDEKYRTSAASAVGRAAIGGFLLGPAGLLAGLSAKKKGKHTIAVYFKNGKKSLLELDDNMYKLVIQELF